MKIIYKEKDGQISVITPSAEWQGTMEQLAQDCVPVKLKYLIVEDSEVPSDRTFRDAWDIADNELTDGVGA